MSLQDLENFQAKLNELSADNPVGFSADLANFKRVGEEKKQKLAEISTKKQAAMPWESRPFSSTGPDLWGTEGEYGSSAHQPQDALMDALKLAASKGQEGIEDPLVEVQRPYEGAPDNNNI